MSLLIQKAGTLIRKGKKSSRDPLLINDTWTDTSISNTMPLRSASRPSERQPQSMNVTLRAAEIARERRGASSTGEKHAIGSETYGMFLDTEQRDDETQEADSTDTESPDLCNMSRDNNPQIAQNRMTRGEIARMRKNELSPTREELDNPAEPIPASAPAEPMLEPAPEPKDHADYVIKYAYQWPGVPDDRLALRRLRMATFRNFQMVRIEPRRLTWKSEGEISVGGEMLFGGNCLADADLFEKYDGHLRRLKPSEREHYQRLYGFLPEEVKAFQDNKDLILSINRAASVELKPELYEHETTQIKEKVKCLHSMAQEMTEGGPDLPLRNQERQREVFHWCVSNIELHWARLMNLAAKRGQLNNEILEAVANGDILLLLVLAGLVTTIGVEVGEPGGSFLWSHRVGR